MGNLNFLVPDWKEGQLIPSEYAFGKSDSSGEIFASDNINPEIQILSVPENTQSLALTLIDPDTPEDFSQVNQPGVVIESHSPRIHFYHWLLVNIEPNVRSIPKGALSQGITEGGKAFGPCRYGLQGLNDYTLWFENDAQLEGLYGGYDGPCPPTNDQRTHRYRFELYALSKPLALPDMFYAHDFHEAKEGLVIEVASFQCQYTLNQTTTILEPID